VDEDATYREKRGKSHVGYKCNAVETCDPENPMQVITSIETASNNADDGALFSKQLIQLKIDTDIEIAVTDGGYNSEALRKACGDEVQHVMSAIRGVELEIVKNKAKLSEYQIQETGKYGTCPAGETPKSVMEKEDGSVVLNFDAKKCFGCEQKGKCLACVGKKQSRLVVDDKRKWMDDFLNLVGTDTGKFLMGLRPAVEGLMNLLKPKYLSGRILFRGLVKVKTRMLLRGIGVNFKRYRVYLVNKAKEVAAMASDFLFFVFMRLKIGRQVLFAHV
ncbi:MAG: transposase, partial [Rectinemataceae bacterium]|nr:transposase [Rectinemataceae bacterium]